MSNKINNKKPNSNSNYAKIIINSKKVCKNMKKDVCKIFKNKNLSAEVLLLVKKEREFMSIIENPFLVKLVNNYDMTLYKNYII